MSTFVPFVTIEEYQESQLRNYLINNLQCGNKALLWVMVYGEDNGNHPEVPVKIICKT